MTWVLVYVGIAFVGLVMVACFAFWLWRKAMALLAELGVLLERGDQLAGLLAQIGQPVEVDVPPRTDVRPSPRSGAGEVWTTDVVDLGRTRRQAT